MPTGVHFRAPASIRKLHDKDATFKSIVYANTAHEYLPEMQAAMLAWLEKHLPVGP